MERSDFTHDFLVDGETRTETLKGGAVTISRFGTFSFYQFNTSVPYRFSVLAQPRTEIRTMFVLAGQDIHVDCDGEMNAFSVGESNCSFVKEGCTQEITIHSDGVCTLFILVVGISDISLPIASSQPHLHRFLNTDKCTWLLGGQNMALGIRKIAVIRQILHERKPAFLKCTYFRLKLAELFVLFLEEADRFGSEAALTQLRPDDLERIRNVGSLLYNQPSKSYSLVGLAHAVGTNETTLKKNFKLVYGTTVFGYLTARRMELAKTLLQTKELKVAAVAHEVGYKYASHFSAAFRKHFGILPNKLLRVLIPAFFLLAELETVYAFCSVLR